MNTELKKLGANIRAIRRSQNLSQEALAEISGLSRPFITQVEHGKRDLSYRTLSIIADALGVKKSEITAQADLGKAVQEPQSVLLSGKPSK
jgi:transcriptional regulator with XRE-family HTH domain